MSSTYDKFNEQAEEFLLKMIQTFPTESNISSMKFYFDFQRSIDKTRPVQTFMSYLEPFGLQIMSKDEHFFKKDEYVKNVESLSEKLGLVDRWAALAPATKESIWSYFQVLYVIGMQTFNKKEDLRKILNEVSKKQNFEYDGSKI